jgi:hypothetical protein
MIESFEFLRCRDFHGFQLVEVFGSSAGEDHMGGIDDREMLLHGAKVINSDFNHRRAIPGVQSEERERDSEKTILTAFGFEDALETSFKERRQKFFGGGLSHGPDHCNHGKIEALSPGLSEGSNGSEGGGDESNSGIPRRRGGLAQNQGCPCVQGFSDEIVSIMGIAPNRHKTMAWSNSARIGGDSRQPLVGRAGAQFQDLFDFGGGPFEVHPAQYLIEGEK